MSNLLVEYNKRHKTLIIPACHNGVCFFNSQEKPFLVALTSLSCRSFSACPSCAINQQIIVEFFMAGWGGSFIQVYHDHVPLETDLLDVIKKYKETESPVQLKPFFAKSPKELDLWMWSFIQNNGTLNFKSKDRFEEMGYAAFKNPDLYKRFYVAYEAFILNRKYMLFEDCD